MWEFAITNVLSMSWESSIIVKRAFIEDTSGSSGNKPDLTEINRMSNYTFYVPCEIVQAMAKFVTEKLL